MTNYLGYVAGDTVRIFDGYGGFTTATVQKVSPSGQVTTTHQRADGGASVQRFTARGDQVGYGGRTWRRGPHLLSKSEQERVADHLRRENAARREGATFRAKLDELQNHSHHLRDAEVRATVVKELRDLAAALEGVS